MAAKTRDVLLQMGIRASDLNFEGTVAFPPMDEPVEILEEEIVENTGD